MESYFFRLQLTEHATHHDWLLETCSEASFQNGALSPIRTNISAQSKHIMVWEVATNLSRVPLIPMGVGWLFLEVKLLEAGNWKGGSSTQYLHKLFFLCSNSGKPSQEKNKTISGFF